MGCVCSVRKVVGFKFVLVIDVCSDHLPTKPPSVKTLDCCLSTCMTTQTHFMMTLGICTTNTQTHYDLRHLHDKQTHKHIMTLGTSTTNKHTNTFMTLGTSTTNTQTHL